ncbi:pyridoxal-phosphate dependent enzyme [Nonomuraea angiospora]|uniref:pyridoxal-phosphate dependent enzyme n=1 Tax=Nonomuraea angiospora TaxID=46172 RepID=UPI003791EAB2
MTYDDVVAARELLADVVVRTPVVESRVLSDVVGGPVHLKCDEGVHAERCGVAKVEATRGYGAEVIFARTGGQDAAAWSQDSEVQAERAAAYPASPAAGHPVMVEPLATMADGIAVGCPGEQPSELIHYLLDRVVTVSEEEISRALVLCLERAKQVVEPAGAVGVAALTAHPQAFEPPVVAVLSGGNIDPMLLARVLRHGLAAAGRYLALRVLLPDRPGVLARLLTDLAALRVSVLDIVHERFGSRLDVDVDEVEVQLQLETRGPEHCGEALDAL